MAGLANGRRGLWADSLEMPTSGHDSIVGTAAPETIDGLAGDDTIRGAGGDDFLIGGKGNDVLDGGEDNDILNGGKGGDTLQGGNGKDRLIGGVGDDSLHGSTGNDIYVFDAGWGVDRVEEGHLLGADRLVFRGVAQGDVRFTIVGNELYIDMGADRVTVGTQYFFGTGADAKVETAQFDDGAVDLRTPQDAWITRLGGAGGDTIEGSIFNHTMDGRAGADSLFGNTGNDSIKGGLDGDSLFGGEGDDVIKGEEGEDFLQGGNGADRVLGGDEDDTIFGVGGADFLDGGAGDDRFLAGSENDTVSGGLGADSLSGEGGDDRLTGGGDGDFFYFTTGGGKDRVVDFEDGIDRLIFFGFSDAYDTAEEILATAVQDGTSVMISVPNNGAAGATKVILLEFDLEDLSTADMFVS